MPTMVKILDLLDLVRGTNPKNDDLKDCSLKLVLKAIIHHINLNNSKIEIKEEHSPLIIQGLRQQKMYQQIQKTPEVQSDPSLDSLSESGLKNEMSFEGNEGLNVNSHCIALNSRKGEKEQQELLTHLEEKVAILQSQIDNLGQIILQNSPFTIFSKMDIITQPVVHTFTALNTPNKSFEEPERIPSSLDPVYKDLKEVLDKIQEEFGEDIGETMRHIKLAADVAQNNRLRQVYFHEEIDKRIRQAEPDEDFKPIRKGPREIIIKKAAELAKDDEAKIGDLTPSKEEVLREEKLLSQLAELRYSSVRKSVEEAQRTIIKPVMSPEEITLGKLNEIIKEHEDIKCYVEYLTYHVNTLADFAEASIPILFASDPNMEGLQQRMREIRLVPSEYVVTKKLQEDLLQFYKTFVGIVDDVETRLTNHAGLLQRHDQEFYEKTRVLSNAVEEARTFMKKVTKLLKKKNDAEKNNEGLNAEKMARLFEDINKMNKENTDILERQRKFIDQLEVVESLLLKMKEEIFNLKAVKLEKIELQKLLSAKADCSLLNSKISETQFSIAFNDLTNGLTSLSSQIGAQNFIWEALVKKITDKLNSVVGKGEFEEFMKHITAVVITLQNSLKQLGEKDSGEAIGTKTKYLRNLACLSCNHGSIMKKANEYPSFPALPLIPPSKTFKRDLSADLPEVSSSSSDITRYVGGNHTIMKPKEKVQRVKAIQV